MAEHLHKIWLIYLKDLKDEICTLDNLLSTVIFGIMSVVVFSFAFQLTDLAVDQAFAAVLWVSIFFGSTLAVQRSFAREEANDAIGALLLAAGDRSSIFLAKLLTNISVLVLFEIVIVPFLWVLLDVRAAQGVNIFLFAAAILFGSWGLAAVGTLINSITVQLPNARQLFPILLFPLLVPILIGSVMCINAALNSESIHGWLYLLICFDLVYTVVPLFLFDYILEG